MGLNTSNDGWIPVEVDELRRLVRDLPIDLYLQLSESNYCHVFSRTTGLDYERLASYRKKGVTHLYARGSDRAQLEEHLRERRLERLLADPSIRPEQKAALVLNWTERTLADVFTDMPISSEAIDDSRKLVLNYVELMTHQPYSLAALLRLVSHHEYLHYHSVAVAVFSAILAKATGRYSADDIHLISWGGFLHDIGATRMEEDFFCDPLGMANGPDRVLLDSHCRIGLEIIQEGKLIPREVGFIVYQHHELPDGSGGPNHLPRSRIYEPALLVAVVDAWSSLISRHPGREALSPAKAFEVLTAAAEQGKIDGDHLQLMKTLFLSSRTSGGSNDSGGWSDAA